MPKIKIDHVLSFSSEDSVHVANNMLNNDATKKWKCKEPGERSATIVLQLERASVISGIDVGNENSAYIEVLVKRSETQDDYKVLVVMSSFMTPLEARQSANINKVRLFVQNQLSKPECEQKWDRVKIVCTQPFNRHVQYGLSFVTFHGPEDKANGPAVQTVIGKFSLRPESPDNLTVGSLFARRTEVQKEPLSPAAAIREASSSGCSTSKTKIKINSVQKNNGTESTLLPRNRNELLYSKDEEEPNEKIDKIIEKNQIELRENKPKDIQIAKTTASPKPSEESNKRKHNRSKDSSPKKKMKVEKQKKAFSELLRGVVLVISGIQNPDRANLRTMALNLGAKYKADWDNTCTHLICAFTNTPKFNQVKGKGKIVKANWIEECCAQRKRVPWRRFALDKRDLSLPESEDEIWEEVKEDIRGEDISTDEEGYDDTKMQKRIEEIQAKQRELETSINTFSEETDEEPDQLEESNNMLQVLPEFFDSKKFFVMLDKDIEKMAKRYIIAYKGIIVANPDEDVDFYITSEENAENFKGYNSKALCIRPDWLWDCHNCNAFVSADDYVL